MGDASISMNHVLSAHLLDGFEQSRRASTPPFGGHGLASYGPPTQLGFSPMAHGNFSQMSMAGNSLSMEQLAEMQAKLNKKLGPEFISQRPGPGGGPKLTYAEGWKVINLANEVFGFNGWSSSVLSITTDYIDQNPETHRYNVGVSALVRVTLRDGAFHEDVGFGALDNAKGKGAALDKCKKEAVTDAIKRTLRNFGNVLGNCLYDKQYVSEIAKVKAPVLKLDQGSLHRRPDLAGPVPNIPLRESTPQPTTSTMRNPPTRPPGNPSPLATSTPIINRPPGSELPTPDTSLVTLVAPVIPPAPQTSISSNSKQPVRSANSVAPPPPARASSSGNVNTRTTPLAPVANPDTHAPPAPVERTSSDQALFDAELAGELPVDGSVYGGSEDDAFFDNILAGELDMEVTDIPANPRATTPQNPKPDSHNPPVAQAGPSNTSGSANSSTAITPQLTRPSTTNNGRPDSSDSKPPRIRLADAIRGGAPGAGGSGPVVGQKRQRTS
ncbi:Rad52/22 family double-strand break repair protein-domain-containing protein [Rhizoctonia solani]|nr:Rad52/22 family double-strand break repair protein-domain-containing protein [Rhizoctonia solani]